MEAVAKGASSDIRKILNFIKETDKEIVDLRFTDSSLVSRRHSIWHTVIVTGRPLSEYRCSHRIRKQSGRSSAFPAHRQIHT